MLQHRGSWRGSPSWERGYPDSSILANAAPSSRRGSAELGHWFRSDEPPFLVSHPPTLPSEDPSPVPLRWVWGRDTRRDVNGSGLLSIQTPRVT